MGSALLCIVLLYLLNYLYFELGDNQMEIKTFKKGCNTLKESHFVPVGVYIVHISTEYVILVNLYTCTKFGNSWMDITAFREYMKF